MRKLLGITLLLALITPMAAFVWLSDQVNSAHKPQKPAQVQIPPGAGSSQIARLLVEKDVIQSSLAFRLWIRWKKADRSLKSGLYQFEHADSIDAIIKRLQTGDIMHFRVTVPEGLRNDEILQLLASKTSVPLEQWQQALKTIIKDESEGHLLPETWEYTKPLIPKRLLRTMMQAQQHILDGLSKEAGEQQRLRIMASVIEKETALDKERPLVSAAIHNRLKKGMPLQMDPTVIYGLYRTTGAFSGNIHRKDLSTDTPWNTYTRKGLPPTPICNPGKASLLAAAAPAPVDYLFFVADGSGGHAFASTLSEHQRNVQTWVKLERARQHGK